MLQGADSDLRLLAGDYLYALGLERLAARGDLEAVGELADLISLAAKIHAEGEPGTADDMVRALWLAGTVAVAAGASPEHLEAKEALQSGCPRRRRIAGRCRGRDGPRDGPRRRLWRVQPRR